MLPLRLLSTFHVHITYDIFHICTYSIIYNQKNISRRQVLDRLRSTKMLFVLERILLFPRILFITANVLLPYYAGSLPK